MDTFEFCLRNQLCLLQLVLYPGVAPASALFNVPVMEVPGIPALMTAAVKINKCYNFVHRSTTVGSLGKTFIGKTFKTVFFVTINVASKGTVTYTEDQGGLFLCQAVILPNAINFLKSHLSGLL